MSIYDFFAKLFNKQEKSTALTENTTTQEETVSQLHFYSLHIPVIRKLNFLIQVTELI